MDRELLIEKYLHGQLTDSEKELLVKEIQDDPSFGEELEIESTFYAKRNLEFKNELGLTGNIEEQILNEEQSTKTNSYNRNIFIVLLALLGIIAAAVLYNQNNKDSNQKMVRLAKSHLAVPFEAPPKLMNNDDVVTDDWSTAMIEYRKNNFEAAALKIMRIQKRTEEQELYLGLSQLFDNNEKNIIQSYESLNSVINLPNAQYKDIALWYAALNCIQQGKIAESKAHLNEIVVNNSWNHEQAKELLKD